MKIAVCSPIFDRPETRYTKSLADLMVAGTRAGHDLEYIWARSSILPVVRNEITKSALTWGAEQLLWLDSDQTFPPNTLERLLKLQRPIAGCNYMRKGEPAVPTAIGHDGKLIGTSREDAEAGKVDDVAGLGLGVVLIARTVFDRMPKPWFDHGRNAAGEIVGEDYEFFRKAREAGFKIALDHWLSWHIGHVGEGIFRFG